MAELREALDGLRLVQKPSKGAPAYSRLVNRRLGRWCAAMAYAAGLTPNQVTGLSALCTFTGIATVALARPTPVTSLAACLALVVGYALDAADGQLARLRGGGTVAGEWLDHVVDAVKLATVHLAVLVSWYRAGVRGPILAVPLAYQVVASVLFFVIILNDRIRRDSRELPAGRSSLAYSLAVVPTDYGLLCLTFSLLWWQAGFRAIYTALAVANLAFLVLALVKWYREMQGYAG
ncbi:MAG TPA: CDP-alcohol phosphatidyltransferase family protein [Acidimicrobiales bacterium]|jgi:phosphatidylglycerophosphate synthase